MGVFELIIITLLLVTFQYSLIFVLAEKNNKKERVDYWKKRIELKKMSEPTSTPFTDTNSYLDEYDSEMQKIYNEISMSKLI